MSDAAARGPTSSLHPASASRGHLHSLAIEAASLLPGYFGGTRGQLVDLTVSLPTGPVPYPWKTDPSAQLSTDTDFSSICSSGYTHCFFVQ